MAKRSRMRRRSSKKLFSATAARSHKLNTNGRVMRGGYRL